jgi:hypothetical protein
MTSVRLLPNTWGSYPTTNYPSITLRFSLNAFSRASTTDWKWSHWRNTIKPKRSQRQQYLQWGKDRGYNKQEKSICETTCQTAVCFQLADLNFSPISVWRHSEVRGSITSRPTKQAAPVCAYLGYKCFTMIYLHTHLFNKRCNKETFPCR